MGIQINGNTDNISAIDGGLTISDLEINQTGISTFNGGVFLPDNKQVKLGNNAASPDLRIYHNIVANTSSPANHLYANSNYIDSHGAGNLFIRTAGSVGTYIGNTDGEHAASFHANGSAVLYHDASEKFRTVADGIQLTSSNHVTQVLKAGGSTSDLQIQFKDSSGNIESAIFCASDAGDLRFKTGGTNERLRIKSGGTVAIPAQGSSNANPRFIFESAVDNNDFTFSQYEDGNGTYTLIGQNLQLTSNGNTNVLDSGHKTAGILFDGRNNGAMMFYTGGTNAYIEAFRITSDGKMGLGTHNPQRLLHLQSTGDALARITSADGNAAYLELGDVSDPDGGKIVYDSGSNLELYTASSPRLRITSGGNLTLGTNVSNERVHIHTPSSLKAQQQFTNTTTGTGAGDGLIIGITGGEEAIFWNQENTSMKFATDNTQHMVLRSTGQLGIGTVTSIPADAKKLTVICDAIGDGIHIGNKENLYPAGSTGYSDIRFSFYDYLTGGYTAGGEAIIRGLSRNAYTNSRTTALSFMTSSDDGDPSSGTATEKVRIGENGGTIISNAGTFPSSTNETVYIQGQGHNGHGTTNTRSVVSIIGAATSNSNTMGLWIGARTNENTAVIGTRTSTGNLAFETYNSGWAERMRLSYDGSFRIGTEGSAARLVTIDAVSNNGRVRIGDPNSAVAKGKVIIDNQDRNAMTDITDPDNYGVVLCGSPTSGHGNGITFCNDNAQNAGAGIIHVDEGSNNLGSLRFYTKDEGQVPYETLRMGKYGNLVTATGSWRAASEKYVSGLHMPQAHEGYNAGASYTGLSVAAEMWHQSHVKGTSNLTTELFSTKMGGNGGMFVYVEVWFSCAVQQYQGYQALWANANRVGWNNFTINNTGQEGNKLGSDTGGYFDLNYSSSGSGGSQRLTWKVVTSFGQNYVRCLYKTTVCGHDYFQDLTVIR